VATLAEITTHDGYIIRAFSSMYVDYGLEITPPNGQEGYFYSPSVLSSETYGYNMCDHCQENHGEPDHCENPVGWTEEEWASALHYEADDLVEAFVMVG
jgi:hypothetical protein